MKRLLIAAPAFPAVLAAATPGAALDVPVTAVNTFAAERESMRKRGVPIYPQQLLQHDSLGCL